MKWFPTTAVYLSRVYFSSVDYRAQVLPGRVRAWQATAPLAYVNPYTILLALPIAEPLRHAAPALSGVAFCRRMSHWQKFPAQSCRDGRRERAPLETSMS